MRTTKPRARAWSQIAKYAIAIGLAGLGAVAGCNSDDSSTSSPVVGQDGSVDATLDASGDAGGCPVGQTACGAACVDTSSDLANCGACGTACKAGEVCSKGTCALSCGAGTTKCGSTCKDTQSDPSNCGACGTTCKTGEVCSNGKCALSCGGGTTQCGSSCVETGVDPSNCGGCGKQCGAGLLCSNGTCGVTCGGGLTLCGASDAGADGGGSTGACVNTKTDDGNCGGCGHACGAGQVCSNGTCALTCQAGFVNCNGQCIDPTSNNAYCGATAGCGQDAGSPGTACASGQVCSAGTCQLTCQSGFVICNGQCVDPKTNNTYCGATLGCGQDAGSAGTACAGGTVCSGGACAVTCAASLVNCNGTCVDPTSNDQYCGATAGCGQDAGSAGTTCAAGTRCTATGCTATCASPLIACSNACVDPRNDPQHCGGCAACALNNATAGCSNSTCNIASCNTGYADCDNSASNGCEINTSTDKNHCGGCNTACLSDGVCTNGACVYPTTCAALHAAQPALPDGVYGIQPVANGPTLTVYCDMTTAGGGWTQVLDQDVSVSPGYAPSATWLSASGYNPSQPNSGQYSILYALANLKGGTNYEFLMDWPRSPAQGTVQWTQVENPLTSSQTPTISNLVESPASQIGCGTFRGLATSIGGQPAALHGDSNYGGCWWWGIGTSQQYGVGIPGYENSTPTANTGTYRARLWVR